MLHHDQPEAVARLIEEFLSADGAVLLDPPDASADAARAPAAEIVRDGGVIAYPTDSCYALGCHLGDKDGAGAPAPHPRHRRAPPPDADVPRPLGDRHVRERGQRAVPAAQGATRRAATPSSCARTREVPRRLLHPQRKTIGVRVPGHPVAQALLAELNEPLLSSTLLLPGDGAAAVRRGSEIRDRLEHELDLVIDAGPCGVEPTTVIDLTGDDAARAARRKRLARAASRVENASDKIALHKMDVNSPRSDGRHLRAPGAVRDHAARGGARLRRAPLRRHDGARAGPHQPQSAAPHRPGRHHPRAARHPACSPAASSCSAGPSRCR